jgi:hypothetical protein
MKRLGVLFLLLAALLLAMPATAAPPIHRATPWWHYGLTFWAPFDDARSPLRLLRGADALAFTRAHDATHTATYVHPGTGLVTVADNNQSRIEEKGVLIEGARINLLLRSDDIGTTWANARSGESVDNTIAPDGALTADKIVEDATATNTHYIYQSKSGASFTDDAIYTFSDYLKAAERTWTYVLAGSKAVAGPLGAFFNLSTGAIGATDAGRAPLITSSDNGWFRPAITWNVSSGAQTPRFDIRLATGDGPGGQTYSGDNTSGLYAWGAQVEIGSFASSVIPTAASVISRNADVLSIPTSGNIDNVDGTLAMEWSPIFASTMTAGAAYYLFDAGPLEAYYNATDQKIYLTDGTNTISTAALTFSANVAQKLAFRWGASGLAIYRNGAEAASGETYTASALDANLYLGSDTAGANQAFSNFKPMRAWDRSFTNTEMQSISR